MPVLTIYRRFCLAKIAKTRKTWNFSRFREKVAQKINRLFVRFDGRTIRAAHIHYIGTFPRVLRRPRPALAIKKFHRFPLCYYYIASMRFCQAIRVLIEKYEYDGLHKYQTYGTFQTSGMFQTFQTTQPPGFSAVVPIFQRQKVDHRRLYCASEKLTAAEE